MSRFIKFLLILTFLIPLNSCGGFNKVDQRERPSDPKERRRQAVDQGKGIGIGSFRKKGSTNYEFSTSNPMWRASLETLEFLPLSTVDYSGGTIITDWYSENTSNDSESIKITVRFLSNEIRSDSLKIIVHKKNCTSNNNCKTSLLSNNSKINSELRSVILKKASIFEKEKKNKKK
tara:strand:- start:1515 stop:2042 length:528 start_codon:yes stop_codon:yes gene_type:complete